MEIVPVPRNVGIHIQGDKVLKLISIKEKEILFDVVGLKNPKVHIVDRRPEVIRKVKEIEQTKNLEQLTNLFCSPARVTFLPSTADEDEIVIQLTKIKSKKPRHMLWIAVNIKGEIPYFDFQNLEVQSYGKKYALFSVYKRPISGEARVHSNGAF